MLDANVTFSYSSWKFPFKQIEYRKAICCRKIFIVKDVMIYAVLCPQPLSSSNCLMLTLGFASGQTFHIS